MGPCDPLVTTRQQDEAAGEMGVPGLEKCPGQIGHPVHTGQTHFGWVRREPRRNSAKALELPATMRGARMEVACLCARMGGLTISEICPPVSSVAEDVCSWTGDQRSELCTRANGVPASECLLQVQRR